MPRQRLNQCYNKQPQDNQPQETNIKTTVNANTSKTENPVCCPAPNTPIMYQWNVISVIGRQDTAPSLIRRQSSGIARWLHTPIVVTMAEVN